MSKNKNKKTILVFNEGSASPFKREKFSISSVFKNALLKNPNHVPIDSTEEFQAIRIGSNRKLKSYLSAFNSNDYNLILVLKSYGCVETFRDMEKSYNKYFSKYNSIKAFFIDGYSLVEYGLDKKSFTKSHFWQNISIYNYRQDTDRKIKGAKFKGADEETVIPYHNHSNIIYNTYIIEDFLSKIK